MTPLVWLAVAIAAGVAAYLVGWPAWRSYRARESRDLNTERYLAWRGRADRRPQRLLPSEGMTAEERRRMVAGTALGVVGLAAFLAFFATS